MATSDCWCSPPEITTRLEEFFEGPVDVDPCSNDRSIVRARLAMTIGGLTLPWRLPNRNAARTVYENDPYSKAGVWTEKMLAELANGNVREIIRLSMMQTSTWWWARMCSVPERNPRVLGLKRIAFLDPFAEAAGEKRDVCRFEPALTYIGPRVKRFEKTFAALTRWSAWGRS